MTSPLAREETAGAFETLYRRHRGDVYRFVLRDVRNPDEAEDVTQTAFLNAFRALQHGDRPEKPRAWLLTIAQNVAKRRFRVRSARPQEVELDADAFAAPEREGPSAAEIREALARLRPNHRAAIVLREIGGLSYAEIAANLNLSVSAVEALLFRARGALREELAAAEERPGLHVGGLVIALPAALTHRFGKLASWFGRRSVTVQAAGALGAAALGVSGVVQATAPARPAPDPPRPVVETWGSAGVPGARSAKATRPVPEARRDRARARARARQIPVVRAGESAAAGEAPDGSRPGAGTPLVELPELPLPSVSLPSVSLPSVPLPSVSLPEGDLADVDVPKLPLPELELEGPELPSADDLVP